MLPESSWSSPAMARNKVDLPHPDAPTMTQNSPSPTARLTPLSTAVAPNDFTA